MRAVRFRASGMNYFQDTYNRIAVRYEDYALPDEKILGKYSEGRRVWEYLYPVSDVELKPEPENSYRPEAIGIYLDGQKAGYVKDSQNTKVKEFLASDYYQGADAAIVGGHFKQVLKNNQGKLYVKNESSPLLVRITLYLDNQGQAEASEPETAVPVVPAAQALDNPELSAEKASEESEKTITENSNESERSIVEAPKAASMEYSPASSPVVPKSGTLPAGLAAAAGAKPRQAGRSPLEGAEKKPAPPIRPYTPPSVSGQAADESITPGQADRAKPQTGKDMAAASNSSRTKNGTGNTGITTDTNRNQRWKAGEGSGPKVGESELIRPKNTPPREKILLYAILACVGIAIISFAFALISTLVSRRAHSPAGADRQAAVTEEVPAATSADDEDDDIINNSNDLENDFDQDLNDLENEADDNNDNLDEFSDDSVTDDGSEAYDVQ
ncbi:MAG: hypothetical protein IJ137_09095 [Eubacterium sp.]|nr:hypothetical protein [Eubacterium sp.]